jgi:hypothetical protein
MPRYAVNAVKKGIQCGAPKSEQEDGQVYMRLDTDQDTGGTVESGVLIFAKDKTIAGLGERVTSLARQLETRSEEAQGPHHRDADTAHTRAVGRSSLGESPGRRGRCWRGKGSIRGRRPLDELRDAPCERSELVAKNFRRRLERSVVVRSAFNRRTYSLRMRT